MTDRNGEQNQKSHSLLPCPWCAKPPKVELTIGGESWWVGCMSDDCEVLPYVDDHDKGTAIAAWNTRAVKSNVTISVASVQDTERWARTAKEALAYWRHNALGSVSSHTAGSTLDDSREGRDVPAWAHDLAELILDFERASGIRVHDGKEYGHAG